MLYKDVTLWIIRIQEAVNCFLIFFIRSNWNGNWENFKDKGVNFNKCWMKRRRNFQIVFISNFPINFPENIQILFDFSSRFFLALIFMDVSFAYSSEIKKKQKLASSYKINIVSIKIIIITKTSSNYNFPRLTVNQTRNNVAKL